MALYPSFAYPGGKAKLAPLIVQAFHPSTTRLVDVFAGRGNVSWAAMYFRPEYKFWMNGKGTAEFLRCFNPPGKKGSFYKLKETVLNAVADLPADKKEFEKLFTLVPQAPNPDYYHKLKGQRNPSALPVVGEIWQHLAHKEAKLQEGYVCFQGGSYDANCTKGYKGARGGVTPKGWATKCELAYEYINQHRPRITEWDFRKVLARCTSHDMVYL